MLFSTRDTWDYRRHGPLGLFRTHGGRDSLPFHDNTLTSSGDLEAKLLRTIHTYTYLYVFFVDFIVLCSVLFLFTMSLLFVLFTICLFFFSFSVHNITTTNAQVPQSWAPPAGLAPLAGLQENAT